MTLDRRTFLSLSALTVGTVTLAACSDGGSGTPGTSTGGAGNGAAVNPDGTLRYATTYLTSTMDPHKTKVTSDVIFLKNVYEALIRNDHEGKATPGLAEKWELSTDAKTITLHLREAKFSDGTPVNADAVKKSLARAMEPDSLATASKLANLASVDTPDAKTVVLNFKIPSSEMVLTLSDLPGFIVNPTATTDGLKTTPAGAGQYTLKAGGKPGAHYELVRNPGYWDVANVKSAVFTWDAIADGQTRLNGLLSGQYDAVITSPAIINPAKQAGMNVEMIARTTPYILNFNRTRSEFAKTEVRQAISYAINRDEVVQALDGFAEAASQMVPKNHWAYNPACEQYAKTDVEKAKALLAQAGLASGFAFEAKVLNLPEYVTVATVVKAQLAKIGITMNLTPLAAADLSPAFNSGQGDAVITAYVGQPDPAVTLASYFTKSSALNPSKSDVPGVPEALAKANGLTDEAARGKAIGEAALALASTAGAVPIAVSVVGQCLSSKVVGFKPSVLFDQWIGVGVSA